MTALRERADGRETSRDRAYYIEALREYADRYGELTAACFSPGSAKRNGRPDLVERYYARRTSGEPWPSLNAIKSAFDGSFVDARVAAGFEPNSTGPAAGRRKAGEAEPILDVRERLVYVPSEKTRQLQDRVLRLEDRLASALDRARRAETVVAEMRERRGLPRPAPPPRPAPRPRAEVRTRTITKTVKVRDERALERLRSKVDDEKAARRAVEDQLRSATREIRALRDEAENLRVSAASSRQEATDAARARDRASDRLAAGEALRARLTEELAEAREQALGAAEAAAASDLVRRAESRAEEAEVRAARAEREMAEQGAAVTGELRRLSREEIDELKTKGPAGPAVFARALRRLTAARRSGSAIALDEALIEVLRAAATWRDRR